MTQVPGGLASASVAAYAAIDAQTTVEGIVATTLGTIERFGATGGFILLADDARPGHFRIAHFHGLDVDTLRAAAKDPAFQPALTGSFEPIVLAPAHPVAQALMPGAGVVSLPLAAQGRTFGWLALVVQTAPSGDALASLVALAAHTALALGSVQLQERLADRGDQLASVVHSMPNPVVVVDDEGRFAMVNGAASDVFNLAGSFEAGQPVGGRLGPELGGLLRRDRDETMEIMLGSPDPRLYRVSSRRVLSGRGASLGRVLVLDDLTVEREADRLKSDFVAVVSQEMRSPLTLVRGYTQTLAQHWRTLDDATREQSLAALDDASRRLERLIEGVLFVAAVEDRLPPLELSREDLLTVTKPFMRGRVTVTAPDGPLWWVLDRAMVEAVLHQLTENALKYSDGPVTVEVIPRDDEVEIAVTDEGEGIFSGDLPLLFHRFSRPDGSATRRQGGMGIGLYISRRLIEGMGGRIWGESRLGLGSRFAFTLPERTADLPPV